MLKKYKIQVKVTETGIYFWSGQQITRVNTKEKAEEVSREIKELLMTPEEKKKIERWNSQLIESWEEIQKQNKVYPYNEATQYWNKIQKK